MISTFKNPFKNALPADTPLQDGLFVIKQVLGQGGFGLTYAAQDVRLRRVVAIKEFFPTHCSRRGAQVVFPATVTADEQAGAKHKFLDEARVLAQLDHPNIVRVHASFEENNTSYMVMEFLEGKTLQKIMDERRRPLPESEALTYIEKVGQALIAVHGTNYIHRDIKPDNVLVCNGPSAAGAISQESRVVLLDFGLNKEISAAPAYDTMRLTEAIRFGSPGYAPPEQYGKQARYGPFTDVYSLGATLYFLLTGEVPVEAPDRLYGHEAKDVRSFNGKVSREVNDAVMWALELRGDRRPQNVPDFLQVLRPALLSAITPTPAAATPAASAPAAPTPATSAPPQPTPPQPTPQPAAPSIAPAARPSRLVQRLQNSPPMPPMPAIPRRVAVSGSPAAPDSSFGRRLWHGLLSHLHAGFIEIWPRLVLVIAGIVLLIMFARQEQKKATPARRAKSAIASRKKPAPRSPRARPKSTGE